MKTQFKILFSAALFLLAGTMALAQSDAEEVPGDNFSLEGALELFKKSASPQEFEQLLNSPDSKVNNLDLNGDGETDYIRVIDKNEGNVHAFILSAVVSPTENQDVAVIELEKKSDGTAVLQIVGDADVYGIETIIEPTEEVRVNAGTTTQRTVVNVWAWPSVQYVYGPAYSLWVSPWGWSYYPGWYRPWRPIAWRVYDPFWAPYRPYYSVCFRHRVRYAPVIYRPYRATSVVVYNRTHNQITSFRSTSHGYRYDRGDYARGSRSNYATRNRSDYNHHSANDRESYSTGRTRSDYNSSRSGGSSRSDVRSTDSRSGNTRRSYENRSADHNRSSDQSVSHNRGSSSGSRSQYHAPVQRQHAPVQRQSAPQMRSTPQQHQRSAPAPSRSNGGGGGGGNASHGRRH